MYSQQLEKLRILFADDEPEFHVPLLDLLESKHITCLHVRSLEEAVVALEKEEISALVTDIMMPTGQAYSTVDPTEAGYSLVRIARERWPTIPMVCLSVIRDKARITELSENGVLYLQKGTTSLRRTANLIVSKALRTRALDDEWF